MKVKMLSDLLDYFNIVDTIDIDPTDRFRIFANKGLLYGFELLFGQISLIIIDQSGKPVLEVVFLYKLENWMVLSGFMGDSLCFKLDWNRSVLFPFIKLDLAVGPNLHEIRSQADPATAVAVPVLKQPGTVGVAAYEIIIALAKFIVVVERENALDFRGILCGGEGFVQAMRFLVTFAFFE
jgi:hypothetical protein